jgi:hypothetical protein
MILLIDSAYSELIFSFLVCDSDFLDSNGAAGDPDHVEAIKWAGLP